MKLQLTFTTIFITLLLAFSSLAFALPAMAAEDEHEAMNDHEHGLEVAVTKASDVATMKVLIQLLTQLLAALQEKAEIQKMDMGHVHDDSHEHEDDEHDDDHHEMDDVDYTISVEEHQGRTHIHVNYKTGEQDMFFIEVDINDREAVYDAIVAQTELDRGDVVKTAIFAADRAANLDDDHEHNDDTTEGSHAGMEGLDGIHIMADGTIMLGNGEALTDATISDEDMIILGDGTEVDPVMDLR